MTDIFKTFASAMDRQIERKRELAAWLAKREGPWLNPTAPDYLDWDYEPSGYQDVSNGEAAS